MRKKSEIFYQNLGHIFDMLGSAIHTSNDIRFFREKEIDTLVKFVGCRIPKEPISNMSKSQFLQLCKMLEIDSDDLEIEKIDPHSPNAQDVFRFIYMHYPQIHLIPAIYRLMCRVLHDMTTDIDLSSNDKTWLKLFLQNKKVDTPADWIDLL